MNKLSMAAFQTEAQAKNQEKLVSDLVAAWSKKNGKVARASGVSLMALTLAACGGEDTTPYAQADIDAALAPVQAALDDAEAAAAAAATAQAAAEASLATAQANLTTALASQATAEAARDEAQDAADAAEAEAATSAAAAETAEAAAAAAATAQADAEAAAAVAAAAQEDAEAAAAAAATAQEEAEAAQAAAEAAQEVAEAALAVATGELADIREALGLDADASAADIVAAIEAKDVEIASLEDAAAGTVTASAASVDEGGAVTFTIAGGAANTSYVVDIAGGTATVDYAGAAQRVVTTDADGNATLTITTIADETTEGAETLTVTVGGLTGATASVTVNDTSTTAANSAPAIANVSTDAIVDNAGGVSLIVAEDAEADVTLSDADGNFAGGSINVAGASGIYFADATADLVTAIGEIDTGEENIAYSVSTDTVIATTTDAEGATVSTIAVATIAATSTTDTNAEGELGSHATGYTITFAAEATSVHADDIFNALTTDTVQDVNGEATEGNVTVTVTDAAGADASFTVMVDSDTAPTLSVGEDTELELAETAEGYSANTVAITDAGGSFNTAGATLTISSDNGSTLDVAGENSVVSGNLLDAESDVIGTITGDGTGAISVTLSDGENAPTLAEVNSFLDDVTVTQGSLGATTVTVTATEADGYEALSAEATLTVVGDFTDATDAEGADLLGADSGEGITLQDLLEASAEAPVTLSGNTYVSVNGEISAEDTNDIDTMIAEGALVVTDSNIVRLEVTGEATDVSGISNLSSLGSTVTVYSVDAEGSLSMTSAQHAEAGAIEAAGDVTITDAQNGLSSDYSNITGEGSVSVVIDTADAEDDGEVADLDLTFSGDLGEATLTLEGEGSLTTTAAALDGVSTAAGEDTSADITVSDAANVDGVDLSGINVAHIGDLNVAFSSDATVTDAETDLGNATLSVGVGATLTSTLDVLNGKTVEVADAVGTGGTSGGVTVNASGELGEAYDLSGITYETDGTAAGAVNGTAAGIVVNITDDATLAEGASISVDAEDASLNVNSGATLTVANSADISGNTIIGEGTVSVTIDAEDEADAETGLDLSNVATGTMSATATDDITLSAETDLGDFDVTVSLDSTLTLTAAQADGLTISGTNLTDAEDGEAAGSIAVTLADGAADAETSIDLSGLSAGSADAEAGEAGTLTLVTTGDNDVTGMTLGSAAITISGDGTLTMSSDQANGASVAMAEGEDASIVVTEIQAGVDLGEVSPDGEGTLTATSTGSVDLTGATLGDLSGITFDDGDAEVDTDHALSLTGSQADALTNAEGALGVTIGGLDAEDSFTVTVGASVVTDAEGTVLVAAEGEGYDIAGASGADSLTGSQMDDTLYGNGGADTISGGAGADTITGGGGQDTMTGGDGDDTFTISDQDDAGLGGSARDIITDFAEAGIAGGDLIDLSALGEDAEAAGEGDLEFLGTNSFTGTGEAAADTVEVRYTVLSGNAIVEADVDGDGTADLQIQVNDVDTLVAADFTL